MDRRDDNNCIQGGEDIENDGGGGALFERRESDASSFSERDGSVREPLLHHRSRINNTSQIAIVGAKVYPIESLDYELIENELIKQDWRSRKRVQIFQYIFLKWTLALLIGLLTGVVAFFNNLAVENIAGFKLLLTSNLMLKDKDSKGRSERGSSGRKSQLGACVRGARRRKQQRELKIKVGDY